MFLDWTKISALMVVSFMCNLIVPRYVWTGSYTWKVDACFLGLHIVTEEKQKLISRCYKVSMLYVVKIELYSGEVFSLFYGESQKLPPFRLMVKLFGQNSLAILRI